MERLPPKLWTSVWNIIEDAVEAATADAAGYETHSKMLSRLVSTFTEVGNGEEVVRCRECE